MGNLNSFYITLSGTWGASVISYWICVIVLRDFDCCISELHSVFELVIAICVVQPHPAKAISISMNETKQNID